MEHLTRQELEAFVLGVPPRDLGALRQHVAACPACARRLSEEARLESLLNEAMLHNTERPNESRHSVLDAYAWLRPLVIAATVLVVAGAVWMLSHRDGVSTLPPGEPLPVESVAQIPGRPDPWVALPGYDVVSPGDLCRHVTLPAGSVPGL